VFTKEMMAALEADAEKLRQLTGEDHGPVFFTEEDMPTFKEFIDPNKARPALTAENVKDELLLTYITEEALNEALGRSLGRVAHHIKAGRPLAFLSASRGERSAHENNKAHDELQKHARAHGFGFQHVLGVGQENTDGGHVKPTHERSLMVVGHHDDKGHLERFAKSMGDHFGQHSVLVHRAKAKGATLIHTKGSETPGHEEDVGSFHANKPSPFHTKVKGNRTLSFESWYFIDPPTFFKRKWTLLT
jgi:hypothetical protein